MNNIAQTLANNITVKDKKSARVTGDFVGVDAYASWKNALETAHTAFYKYERAKISLANGTIASIKTERSNAVDALRAITTLIGEVNGVMIDSSVEALDTISKYAIKDIERLAGTALTLDSEIKNLKKQLDEVSTGMNPDYVTSLEEALEAKEEELRLEKKRAGSAVKTTTMTTFSAFVYNAETRLAKIITKQEAQSYEEIVAEREAKKAANRAKAKARRDANKAKKANVTVEVAEAINAAAQA